MGAFLIALMTRDDLRSADAVLALSSYVSYLLALLRSSHSPARVVTMRVSQRDRNTMLPVRRRLQRDPSLTAILFLLCICNGFLVASAFSPTPLAFRSRSTDTVTASSTCSRSSKTPVAAVSPSSFVELTDPETGCQVLLLGCFHGSNNSASDVLHLVDTDTDVVVLELCATRFADLRRDYLATSCPSSSLKRKSDEASKRRQRPWILRYSSMVLRTSKTKGFGAGFAAALLGGVSGVQTSLSGLVPGLEFTTAFVAAAEMNADIVLADQVVDETLNKIGNLPATSLGMWRDLLQTRNWHDTFGQEAAALQTAVLGNDEFRPQQVSLPAFLTRSQAALQEMVRSTLPSFLLLQTFVASANTAAERLVLNPVVAAASAFATDSASATASLPPAQDLVLQQADMLTSAASATANSASLGLAVFNVAILVMTYLSVALPGARVVIRERDERLTAGIQQACRLAVQEKGTTNSTPPKVVAVLGLLHVNGVAQRILSSWAPPEGTRIEGLLESDVAPLISSAELLAEPSLVLGNATSS